MTDEAATPGRVVVVGASAGGVPALSDFVAVLEPRLLAAVLVVLHLPPGGRSALATILGRVTRMPVANPRDREPLVTGNVYIAPPDHHLLVDGSMMRVTRGPWENGHRPSVDALFRSAAASYRERAIGVVLTGALDDGAAGLARIAAVGGIALVQDPADAAVAGMPEHALLAVPDAMRCDLAALAHEINGLVGTGPRVVLRASSPRDVDVPVADLPLARGELCDPEASAAAPAGFGRPDCGGSLFAMSDDVLRYRCRVGHGWTAEALRASHGTSLEQALWQALRVLEENREIDRRLETRASERGRTRTLRHLDRRRQQREYLASVLRAALGEIAGTADAEPAEDDA